jgi:hypothetical protein
MSDEEDKKINKRVIKKLKYTRWTRNQSPWSVYGH